MSYPAIQILREELTKPALSTAFKGGLGFPPPQKTK